MSIVRRAYDASLVTVVRVLVVVFVAGVLQATGNAGSNGLPSATAAGSGDMMFSGVTYSYRGEVFPDSIDQNKDCVMDTECWSS